MPAEIPLAQHLWDLLTPPDNEDGEKSPQIITYYQLFVREQLSHAVMA